MTLKIHSTEAERLAEYRICQERGHQPRDIVLTTNPPLDVCRHCGTHYRRLTVWEESNKPEGAE